MTKRRIACLCLAVLFLMPMLLSGCGKAAEKPLAPYTANSQVRCDADTAMVENEKYTLAWSDELQRFAFMINETGETFMSAPLDYSADDGISAPIEIGYTATETQTETTPMSGAANCLAMDTFSSEKLENGFRAVYSFDEAEIAVTVEYLLCDDGLEIRIPMDGLQENKNRLCEISLAPFMASVQKDTDSYLMVPSGSGSLIYATSTNKAKNYSEPVYGADRSEPVYMQQSSHSQIYLPVFGAMNKVDNTGIIGIVEGGVDCAVINASNAADYANVYASFNIRSRENVVYNERGGDKKNSYRFSHTVTACEYLSVRYIPLSAQCGDDITYNGMAACYRQYLQNRNYLQNPVENVPALSVSMLGGTQITESFFGIPYMTDVATTTVAQTQAIASELKGLVGDQSMLLSLIGYGQGGLANSTIAGGYSLSSKVGKQKDMKALIAYAKENGITLSMDYELAKFQSSGNGVRVNRDAAWGVSTLKAKLNSYQMHTGQEDTKGLYWYLTSPAKLADVMDDTIKAAKKSQYGTISIGSLNHMMYSDFQHEGYAAMTGFSAKVEELLGMAKQNELQIVANNANAYAAVNADFVTEAPLHSTRFNSLDEDIPFYALVFKGYVPLTSSSINLAVNTKDAYLQAVATGMTLQFTLCNNLHESVQYDPDTAFVSSRYVDWKDEIAAMVAESAEVYAKVGNQAIVSYVKDGDVSTTTFANGVTLLVNYADAPVTVDGVEIPANSFIYR